MLVWWTDLVQQYASAHVSEGDEGHDDEGADEVALGPGLEDELLAVGGLGDDVILLPGHVWKGAHGVGVKISILEAGSRGGSRGREQ